MGHQIDHSKGKAAFIAYQAPGWHALGKVKKTGLITIEEALEDGGLSFHVDKCANIHRLSNGIDIVSDSSFFTVRTDVYKVLGSRLGTDYTVYQNTEALAIVDDLLKSGKMTIETAGALDGGRKVFVCLKLADSIVVDGDDEVQQYVLLTNSHDGSMAITAMPTNVRVVCANTLSAALAGAKGAHKIRHTKNAADRVKEAFTIMGMLEDNSKKNEAAYNAMKHNGLSKEEFFDYIGNVFMTGEEITGLQQGDKEALSTRKKNTVSEVLQYASSGVGQTEALGDCLNMWYGYNAVTGYLTSKKYSSADDRFESLFLGDSAKKIAVAGELALRPQNIRSLSASATKIAGMNQNFN